MTASYRMKHNERKGSHRHGGSRLGNWMRRTGSFLRNPFRKHSRTAMVVAPPASLSPFSPPMRKSTIKRTGNTAKISLYKTKSAKKRSRSRSRSRSPSMRIKFGRRR